MNIRHLITTLSLMASSLNAQTLYIANESPTKEAIRVEIEGRMPFDIPALSYVELKGLDLSALSKKTIKVLPVSYYSGKNVATYVSTISISPELTGDDVLLKVRFFGTADTRPWWKKIFSPNKYRSQGWSFAEFSVKSDTHREQLLKGLAFVPSPQLALKS